jgi:cellobiose-specific phosphotransferase system component IIC
VVAGLLQQQGYVLAIQDGFLISVGIILFAIIAVFFIRGRKAPQQAEPVEAETPTDEASASRDEAMLAV